MYDDDESEIGGRQLEMFEVLATRSNAEFDFYSKYLVILVKQKCLSKDRDWIIRNV